MSMRLGSLIPREPPLGAGARESGHEVAREPNFVRSGVQPQSRVSAFRLLNLVF